MNQRAESEFVVQECFGSGCEGGGRGAVLLAGLAFRDGELATGFGCEFLLEACDLYF